MRSLSHPPLEFLAISNTDKKRLQPRNSMYLVPKQKENKTRDSNLRAGSNGTLNKSSKSKTRLHVSDFGLKILG